MMRHTRLLFLSVCLMSGAAFSQTFLAEHEDSIRMGIVGGVDLNMHSADFQGFSGVASCCPRYESGQGTSPSIGALLYIPFDRHWSLDLRVSYVTGNGTLTADEPTSIIVNNTQTDGTFRHTVVATLASLGYEMFAVYKIVGDFQAAVGGRAAFMTTRSFTQKEELVQPATTGTFMDGTRIRNEHTGAIPNASQFEFALLGGIRYELPLDAKRSMLIVPEVLYSLGLGNITADQTWKYNAVRFDLSLQFNVPHAPVARSGGR